MRIPSKIEAYFVWCFVCYEMVVGFEYIAKATGLQSTSMYFYMSYVRIIRLVCRVPADFDPFITGNKKPTLEIDNNGKPIVWPKSFQLFYGFIC